MRAGGQILMIFGLVLGIIAAAATFVILQRSPAAGEEAPVVESANVIIAFQPIEPWQEIPAGAVGVREYPLPLPTDAVTEVVASTDEQGEPIELSGTEFVTGKISNTRIYPGQVIVTTQLVDKELEEDRLGLGSTASYIVPDGQYAIAIPIDQISSIAGALRAGDQVDVIATFLVEDPLDPEGEGEEVTQLLMQKVQILRVGPWAVTEEEEGGGEGGNVVTILAEPQQALEFKALEFKVVDYDFVLRSITDEADYTTEPVDDAYLNEQYNVIP